MSTSILLPENGKLCLLRLSAIGDVCHAMAMVQRIRRQRPDVQITWVIGKVEYQLLKGLTGVSFVVFDKKAGKAGMAEVKKTLANTTFDVLCVMQIALRANWLSRKINAKVRLGFDKSRSKEGHSLFINKRIATQTHPHVLDGFMAFADAMGIPKEDTLNWDMPYTEQDCDVANQLTADFGRYVVMSPAASKAQRNWTVEGYSKVAEHLASKGLSVILCGGPGPLDKQLETAILQQSTGISRSLVGQTNLKQQLAILAGAELVIAPDTGPAHMATTVNTPVIGLYAHSNPRRTGPYNNVGDVVSVYDACILEQKGKPWQDLRWGVRAKGETLMTRITVNEVCEKVDKLIPK